MGYPGNIHDEDDENGVDFVENLISLSTGDRNFSASAVYSTRRTRGRCSTDYEDINIYTMSIGHGQRTIM